MKKKYLHKEDAIIERCKDDSGRDVVRLKHSEGNLHMDFPGNMTDDDVFAALEFANKAYDAGFCAGEMNKARQLRECIGLV